MAVVKADAYGHGDVAVARAALEAGAAWIGVALVEEGLRLRDAGIDAPDPGAVGVPARLRDRGARAPASRPACTRTERSGVWRQRPRGRDVGVHVKVDTGHAPGGRVSPRGDAAVRRAGRSRPGCAWRRCGPISPAPPRTRRPRCSSWSASSPRSRTSAPRGFEPALLHAANSGATILYPETHLDLVRTGIAMYGLEPAPGVGDALGLRPALTWRSTVVRTARLPAGERVSYGHRYRLDRDANVATVPVGYADGYPHLLSSRADVVIRGQRCRVAGSVTMDQLIVDCGDVPVEPGDDVVLIGRSGEAVRHRGGAGRHGRDDRLRDRDPDRRPGSAGARRPMSRKRTAAIAAAVAAGTVAAGAAVGVLSGRRHRAVRRRADDRRPAPRGARSDRVLRRDRDRHQGGRRSRRAGAAVHARFQPGHVRLARAVDRSGRRLPMRADGSSVARDERRRGARRPVGARDGTRHRRRPRRGRVRSSGRGRRPQHGLHGDPRDGGAAAGAVRHAGRRRGADRRVVLRPVPRGDGLGRGAPAPALRVVRDRRSTRGPAPARRAREPRRRRAGCSRG